MNLRVLYSVLGAIVLMASPVYAVTMEDIILGNLSGCGIGCYQIGDKQFSDFDASNIDEDQVNVFGSQIDSTVFINFQAPFLSPNLPGGGMNDYALFYTVTSLGPLIDSIDQSFNLSAAGNGGTVLIGETVFTDALRTQLAAQSSVSFFLGVQDANDPPGEVLQGDQLVVNPAQASLFVTKDISTQGNVGGIVGATVITQSFHQVPVVPEPSSMILLGTGLVGAAAFARRRMRRK